MQRYRGFCRFHRSWILRALALTAALLMSACASGWASTLSGVGCADPSCNEVIPGTRKVLACVGRNCDEPLPPAGGQDAADPTDEGSDTAAPPVAASSADARPPQKAEESGDDGFSLEDLEVRYERFERH